MICAVRDDLKLGVALVTGERFHPGGPAIWLCQQSISSFGCGFSDSVHLIGDLVRRQRKRHPPNQLEANTSAMRTCAGLPRCFSGGTNGVFPRFTCLHSFNGRLDTCRSAGFMPGFELASLYKHDH